jgi:hypothetical protein
MDDVQKRVAQFVNSVLRMASPAGQALDGCDARRLEIGPVGWMIKVREVDGLLTLEDYGNYNA